MARRPSSKKPAPSTRATGRLSSLLDTRVIYCGDNLDPWTRRLCQGLEQLAKLPAKCVDLIYIDPPFNSNRIYEGFWPLTNDGRKATPSAFRPRSFVKGWGESKEKRSFDDRHASTQALDTSPCQGLAYIDTMRPVAAAPQRLARVLKPTGSFCYHCDWHTSRQWHNGAFAHATRRAKTLWKTRIVSCLIAVRSAADLAISTTDRSAVRS